MKDVKKTFSPIQPSKVVKHNNFIFWLVILCFPVLKEKNAVNIRNYIIVYKIFPH